MIATNSAQTNNHKKCFKHTLRRQAGSSSAQVWSVRKIFVRIKNIIITIKRLRSKEGSQKSEIKKSRNKKG